MYKLAVVLKVPKIWALIRKTPSEAIETWRTTMPDQVDEILQTGRVCFVLGDLTAPQLGSDGTVLIEMQKEVTIVIHAAANISLRMSMRDIVKVNCLPALELACMAANFAKLQSFVQVSTAYVLTDRPGGAVEEKVYQLPCNAEQTLDDIIAGRCDNWSEFPWPYGKSKRLIEIILTSRFAHRLPLLIARPSQIGPAIKEPCELYMPMAATPLSSWSSRLMHPVGGTVLFGVEDAATFGRNVLDEIPVDLVSNVIFQHIQRGTQGVVNASSQLFVPRTFNQFLEDLQRAVPDDWRRKLPVVTCTANLSVKLSMLADLYRVHTREYLILADRSRHLDLDGPIGLGLAGFDMEEYASRRMKQVYIETVKTLQAKNQKSRKIDELQPKM